MFFSQSIIIFVTSFCNLIVSYKSHKLFRIEFSEAKTLELENKKVNDFLSILVPKFVRYLMTQAKCSLGAFLRYLQLRRYSLKPKHADRWYPGPYLPNFRWLLPTKRHSKNRGFSLNFFIFSIFSSFFPLKDCWQDLYGMRWLSEFRASL